MRSIKLAVMTAALALCAVPAFASPPVDENGLTRAEARELARGECAEFKRNFADNRSQFGKCISAGAQVVRTRKRPGRTCNEAGLSHRKQGDERRSDFSACVIAAAQADKQAEEPISEPVEEPTDGSEEESSEV